MTFPDGKAPVADGFFAEAKEAVGGTDFKALRGTAVAAP